MKVVGEVGDVRMFGLEAAIEPAFYLDYRQITPGTFFVAYPIFTIRTTGAPNSVVSEAKSVIQSVEPAATFQEIVPMQELVNKSIGGRGSNKLFSNFDPLWLAFPISSSRRNLRRRFPFDCSAHSRNRNPHGARRRRTRHRPTRNDARHAPRNLGSQPRGPVACWAITRFFKALMFGITPTDPLTFSIVSALLLLRLLVRLPHPFHPHHEHQPSSKRSATTNDGLSPIFSRASASLRPPRSICIGVRALIVCISNTFPTSLGPFSSKINPISKINPL